MSPFRVKYGYNIMKYNSRINLWRVLYNLCKSCPGCSGGDDDTTPHHLNSNQYSYLTIASNNMRPISYVNLVPDAAVVMMIPHRIT